MKRFTRVLTLLLTVAMMIGSTSCGQTSKPTPTSSATSSEKSATTAAGNPIIQFPLENEVTFNFMIKDGGYDVEKLAQKNKFWSDIEKKTNVKIKWTYLGSDPTATLNAMFAAGTAGDALPGTNSLNDANISLFSGSGMLAPIEKYVSDPELMPNFHKNVLAESPVTIGKMTAPDSHIYALVAYDSYKPLYLESAMLLETSWLKKLNLSVPKTIDQLHDVLVAFRDNDCNGNGNPNDEIPLFFWSTNPGYGHLQALLSSWGIATKDSSLDSYVQVKNRKVNFVPMMDAWKDAIKTIGQWTNEGLIWSEAFTANASTYNAILKSNIPVAGCYTDNTIPSTSYADEYEFIITPNATGYKSCVYMNPGVSGNKNCFVITSSCKNQEILLAWLDQFYDLDNTMALRYNYPGEGRIELTSDKKYNVLSLTKEQNEALNGSSPTITTMTRFANVACNMDAYKNRIVLTKAQDAKGKIFDMYQKVGILNEEIWPRPYFDTNVSTRIGELRTDIFNIVNTYSAKWASGNGNINSEWGSYVALLKSAGIDEYVSIMQKSYDVYMKGIESYK